MCEQHINGDNVHQICYQPQWMHRVQCYTLFDNKDFVEESYCTVLFVMFSLLLCWVCGNSNYPHINITSPCSFGTRLKRQQFSDTGNSGTIIFWKDINFTVSITVWPMVGIPIDYYEYYSRLQGRIKEGSIISTKILH